MNKNHKKRNCAVCGDISIGRNFGAITCESCKAFFRRTALKSDGLVCKTNGKCVINTKNRRSCKKCRLKKCLASGMIKELILKNNEKMFDESEKLPERDRADSGLSSIGSSSDSNISSSPESTLIFSDFDKMFENCYISDEEISKEIMEIEEFISDSPLSVESETKETQKVIKNSIIAVVRPIATYNKNLNDIELKRLEELSDAVNCLECLSRPLTENIIEFKTLKELYTNSLSMQQCDRSVREFVKFCKHLSTFQEICPDDQLALVKDGCYESGIWQQIVLYNFNNEHWLMSLANGVTLRFSIEIVKSENLEAYNFYRNFFKKLSPDWILDPTLRNLLSVVSLFNPNRPGIKHRKLVKLKQQTYLYLLQKYLIQKYGSECESMEKCSKMLRSIEDCQIIKVYAKEIENEYKQYLTPLLREFID